MARRKRSKNKADVSGALAPASSGLGGGAWAVDSADDNAGQYGVRIEDVRTGPQEAYWRAVRVRLLSAAEYQGRDEVLVIALDEHGERLAGVRVCFRSNSDEEVIMVGEGGATAYPLCGDRAYSVEVVGATEERAASERVCNLHAGHPDELSGDTGLDYSFLVVFQWMGQSPLVQELKVDDEPSAAETFQEAPESGPHKPIAEYVLFGNPGAPDTRTSMLLAVDYLLARKPAFGFVPQEAESAEQVLVIGNTQEVSEGIEDALAGVGCSVQRISGDSSTIQRLLSNRLQAHVAETQSTCTK